MSNYSTYVQRDGLPSLKDIFPTLSSNPDNKQSDLIANQSANTISSKDSSMNLPRQIPNSGSSNTSEMLSTNNAVNISPPSKNSFDSNNSYFEESNIDNNFNSYLISLSKISNEIDTLYRSTNSFNNVPKDLILAGLNNLQSMQTIYNTWLKLHYQSSPQQLQKDTMNHQILNSSGNISIASNRISDSRSKSISSSKSQSATKPPQGNNKNFQNMEEQAVRTLSTMNEKDSMQIPKNKKRKLSTSQQLNATPPVSPKSVFSKITSPNLPNLPNLPNIQSNLNTLNNNNNNNNNNNDLPSLPILPLHNQQPVQYLTNSNQFFQNQQLYSPQQAYQLQPPLSVSNQSTNHYQNYAAQMLINSNSNSIQNHNQFINPVDTNENNEALNDQYHSHLYSKQQSLSNINTNTTNSSIDENECLHCSSRGTPEWRRGPDGERTLCNACGLFYAKLIKKYGEQIARSVMAERKRKGKSTDRRISIS